jgi:4-amino-4-deoxy-L-arabinose transferase-like glycosyltransferase
LTTSGSSTKTTSVFSASSDAPGRRRWLIAILLLAAVTGCYCLGTPFSASFRECQTAMIARNLWRDGIGGILYPRIDFLGSQPGYMLLEFPLYNALVALACALAGPREWLGQLVSLLCSLGAVALLYGIVRRTDDEHTARAAGAIMALTPLQQFIGQSFLPEPLLMLSSLAALYGMVRYAHSESAGWLVLASLAAAGAMLVKAPAGLVLLLPLAFLAWTRFGWRAFAKPSVLLAAGFALVVYVLWQTHADRVNAQHYPYFVSTGEHQRQWNFGPLAMRWDWRFYARILGRLAVYLSPVVALAAAAGFFQRPTLPHRWLFHVWLAANAAYVLICANLHFAHKHYQIVFVPVFAALAARAAARWLPRWRLAVIAAAGLLVIYDAWLGLKLWREQRDPLLERACAALRDLSQPGDLVLIADFHGRYGLSGNHTNNPVALYLANRRGWNAPLYSEMSATTVEEHRQKGARWLLLVVSDAKLSRLANQLIPRYRLARMGEDYVVFDLTGPS